MIEVSECRISWDGRYLYLNTNISSLDYFTDCYIDSIDIDTDETFLSAGPSSKAVNVYSSGDKNEKSVSLSLEYRDLGTNNLLKDRMYFIWIRAKGTPSSDTPCNMDSTLLLCVAFNESLLFNNGLSYINELSDTCNVPVNFQNWILIVTAFKLALDTGDYSKAIELWNEIHSSNDIGVTSKCGCNG